MLDLKISLAKENDLTAIMAVYSACAQLMNKNGLYNWNENYPDLDTVSIDIKNEELFIGYFENQAIGAITLKKGQPFEYINQLQLNANDSCLTIKRLAVSPNFQNKGIANILMNFAEQKAISTKIEYIRLDAYINSLKVIQLYRKRNYKELGFVQLPDLSEPCLVFECKL